MSSDRGRVVALFAVLPDEIALKKLLGLAFFFVIVPNIPRTEGLVTLSAFVRSFASMTPLVAL